MLHKIKEKLLFRHGYAGPHFPRVIFKKYFVIQFFLVKEGN